MQSLSGKKILLGITGSIAAYKSIQVVRNFVAAGGDVQVVITAAGRHFVPVHTLQIFSKKPVLSDLFEQHSDVLHLTLAIDFDLIVIAPVTADFIAKMAWGLADDLLSTLLLSTSTSILLAPAMDLGMWDHPAVRQNVSLLAGRGCTIIDPQSGPLASGKEGIGRMAEPDQICDHACLMLAEGDRIKTHEGANLSGEVVLVTAGPTQEAIDPVRYISNRSSGKMGYAIADAARKRGADVILISGPTSLPAMDGMKTIRVQSTEEMAIEVSRYAPSATIVIMAAAVSDYTPAKRSDHKQKRGPYSLELVPTEDILLSLQKGQSRGQKFLVGFAAETEHLYENAWAKLKTKGLDLIVANDVTQEGAGFDSDTNIVDLIDATGKKKSLPKMSKRDVADHILKEIVRLRDRA
jgi:phosphopantothenoylcysteine decarboxylase/phosphopantothenate--cysteine ligase